MAGLILSPILLILIKELIQQGYLQSWIYLPQEEFIVSPFASNGPSPSSKGKATPTPPETQASEESDNKSNI
jgi:hypothetical protein